MTFLCPSRFPSIRALVLLLTTVPWGLCLAASSSRVAAREKSASCGPVALESVLSLLGDTVSAAKCAELAETDANGVTTMAGLVRAARSLDIPARAMHLTPDELAAVDTPSILHVVLPHEKDHFVVFRGRRGRQLEIGDPSGKIASMLMTPAQLRLMWDGNCLVFTGKPFRVSLIVSILRARNVLSVVAGLALGVLGSSYVILRFLKGAGRGEPNPTGEKIGWFGLTATGAVVIGVLSLLLVWTDHGGPTGQLQLVPGMSVLDVGEIEWTSSFATSVWICNAGQGPVKIYNDKVKSSVAWIRARATDANLPARAKGELKISVMPRRRVGPFEHTVLIPSSGSVGPATLEVKGFVLGPGVPYPSRFYFGRVKPRQLLRKEFIYFARKPDAHVQKVSCGSHLIEAHITKKNSFVTAITVVLSAPTKAGSFQDTVEIVADDQSEKRLAIPLEGTVESGVDEDHTYADAHDQPLGEEERTSQW